MAPTATAIVAITEATTVARPMVSQLPRIVRDITQIVYESRGWWRELIPYPGIAWRTGELHSGERLEGWTIVHHIPILFPKRLAPASGLPGDAYTGLEVLIIVTREFDVPSSDVARGLFADREWLVGERLAGALCIDLGPGCAGRSVG